MYVCGTGQDRVATLAALEEEASSEALSVMTLLDRDTTHRAILAQLGARGSSLQAKWSVTEALGKLRELLEGESAAEAALREGVMPESEGGPSESLVRKLLAKGLLVTGMAKECMVRLVEAVRREKAKSTAIPEDQGAKR